METEGVQEGRKTFHQAQDADGQESPECKDAVQDDGTKPERSNIDLCFSKLRDSEIV